ncbi:MAG: glutamate racemase [Pseudanabaenaceae cyanobacterium bins.68]|nr:glutamate racemase [Pseudanabaenaceae cyanobacterium bins.68]
MANKNPIGIFDSGVGGLTVLTEVRRRLPRESIVYLGDTARLPYGSRSPAEIVSFVEEILVWMQAQQAKMVIMACNTSSALALDLLRDRFDFPILGVILPGARAAVNVGRRIGIIATAATVASNAYPQAIAESCLETEKTAQVWQVACPAFVEIIESGRINHPSTVTVVQEYLQPLIAANIDTLVFGCTHYPHLAGVLRRLLPEVRFVDPAIHVVKAAAQELEILGLRQSGKSPSATPPSINFYVSGDPQQFAQISSQWLGMHPQVEQVYMSPVVSIS